MTEIRAEKARRSLGEFVKGAFSIVDPGAVYKHNWHIDLIAEYLEACTRREIRRLIINQPPRSLKSVMGSVSWPAWLMGRNPSERILALSYAQKLALKHSTDCRLVIRSPWFKNIFPEVELTEDQDTKEKFVTTKRGQRFAASFGGSAIGDGGNFIIVDDPINPSQALSEVERNTANTWFDQNVTTRLDDKKTGVIVVVMQRLHVEDVAGHLLQKGGWTHLNIPAIAEARTVYSFGSVHKVREEGDILHPDREGFAELERQKIDLGSYAFAGQYQQRPVPLEGGVFKAIWLKRYLNPLESYRRIIHSWDTASKPAQLNDPSSCTIWGEHDSGWDLLGVLVRRLEYPDLKRLVHKTAEDWGAHVVLIEDKASGQQLIQDLRASSKLPIIAVNPDADKLTRAATVTALIEAGKVRFPMNAMWLPDFEAELLQFPNAAHDDQVDSLTQFLNWARSSARTSGPRIRSL